MKRFVRGLIVGKFCPLHKGHEYLISRACEQCDELVVFSYLKPEFPDCPAHRRRRWLESCVPHVRSFVFTDENVPQLLPQGPFRSLPIEGGPEDEHRHFVAVMYSALIGEPLDAIFTSESYGPGFVSYMNRYFAESTSLPARVQHIEVDRSRFAVPVSGTAVREDPYRFRHFLSPSVYRDFVRRVCFFGAESTGKTTLTERLAADLGTVSVDEFGRSLWVARGGNLSFEDMALIARTQVANEERLVLEANRFLFIDTSPLTTLFYSLHYFGEAPEELKALANRTYDAVFLCMPDFPYVQDGTRSGEDFRMRQHDWYRRELPVREMPYVPLAGDLEARIASVIATLLRS